MPEDRGHRAVSCSLAEGEQVQPPCSTRHPQAGGPRAEHSHACAPTAQPSRLTVTPGSPMGPGNPVAPGLPWSPGSPFSPVGPSRPCRLAKFSVSQAQSYPAEHLCPLCMRLRLPYSKSRAQVEARGAQRRLLRQVGCPVGWAEAPSLTHAPFPRARPLYALQRYPRVTAPFQR